MKPSAETIAVGKFARGLLVYVEDGNVIELHDCGFIQELRGAIKAAGLDDGGKDEDDKVEQLRKLLLQSLDYIDYIVAGSSFTAEMKRKLRDLI